MVKIWFQCTLGTTYFMGEIKQAGTNKYTSCGKIIKVIPMSSLLSYHPVNGLMITSQKYSMNSKKMNPLSKSFILSMYHLLYWDLVQCPDKVNNNENGELEKAIGNIEHDVF